MFPGIFFPSLTTKNMLLAWHIFASRIFSVEYFFILCPTSSLLLLFNVHSLSPSLALVVGWVVGWLGGCVVLFWTFQHYKTSHDETPSHCCLLFAFVAYENSQIAGMLTFLNISAPDDNRIKNKQISGWDLMRVESGHEIFWRNNSRFHFVCVSIRIHKAINLRLSFASMPFFLFSYEALWRSPVNSSSWTALEICRQMRQQQPSPQKWQNRQQRMMANCYYANKLHGG